MAGPSPRGAVVFTGSSTIRMWATLAEDFPKTTVINRGFGGAQLPDVVRFAPRIVLPLRPRQVVLFAEDGVHLTEAGYDVWREAVRGIVG